MTDRRARPEDPFLLNYNATDLRIASEFLSTWLPFLSRGLCRSCTHRLSNRIRSLNTGTEVDAETSYQKEDSSSTTQNDVYIDRCDDDNCDSNSLGSWKDNADLDDTVDTNSIGSWKDETAGCSVPVAETPLIDRFRGPASVESSKVRMSWADMAQEDELEAEEENEAKLVNGMLREPTSIERTKPKLELSRDQRERIRFNNVGRKKDFICLERVNGKIVNVLDGLELHTSVFSAAEQKRIVDFIYELQEKGKKGELKARTYSEPEKWMRGKGRVTIQFGCCYNYATDKNGNPPGILKNELVDPIPQLFKVIIKRLVSWHVLPHTCIPDSCIVNLYEEGDCIPPHIDNHDFVRPFCTVSFLSECSIVFGSKLNIIGPGEFNGAFAILLPVGSVLVLNGKSADVAKHCVPSVPTKRISITFRKMDESKKPNGFTPEPDLQGLQPLSYGSERSKQHSSNFKRSSSRQAEIVGYHMDRARASSDRGSEFYSNNQNRQRYANRRRVKTNLEN